MKEVLFFIGGMILGGFLGIAFMCMLQVGRRGDIDSNDVKEDV